MLDHIFLKVHCYACFSVPDGATNDLHFGPTAKICIKPKFFFCIIALAKPRGQGSSCPPLFVLTRSVGKSITFVGTLSLSVADFVCV